MTFFGSKHAIYEFHVNNRPPPPLPTPERIRVSLTQLRLKTNPSDWNTCLNFFLQKSKKKIDFSCNFFSKSALKSIVTEQNLIRKITKWWNLVYNQKSWDLGVDVRKRRGGTLGRCHKIQRHTIRKKKNTSQNTDSQTLQTLDLITLFRYEFPGFCCDNEAILANYNFFEKKTGCKEAFNGNCRKENEN